MKKNLMYLCLLYLLLSIGLANSAQQQTPSGNTKTSKKSQIEMISNDVNEKVDDVLDKITPDKNSLLEQQHKKESQLISNPFGIAFYKPTYILPFYYTVKPFNSVYKGNTPDNQQLKRAEFKGQLSFKFPIWPHFFSLNKSINIGYTQLSYWQFYAKSQYFRETNYEPEIFFIHHFRKNWFYYLGLDHESNGRGGNLERSWNRAYLDLKFSGDRWLVSIRPWILIFTPQSSKLHNPNIAHYLGYERVLVAYKVHKQTISLFVRNIESGFTRGSVQASWSFPITKHIKGYAQFFSGYGQSLIEYNHRTSSFGFGISLSDWA